MPDTYMDDNSILSVTVDNLASSQAKNPSNIVELVSADSSVNTPLFFSGDPIIEANMKTKAQMQAAMDELRLSTQQSGQMNKAPDTAPLKAYDAKHQENL